MACAVGSADEFEQPGIFPGMIAQRLVQPCVGPCASHPQNPAHQCDCVVTMVLVHKAVLHSGSLAKYRAASLRDPAPLRCGAVANEGEEPRFLLPGVPSIAVRSVGRYGLDLLVQAMRRNAQTGRHIRNAITAFNHLPDGFFLEFRGKSLWNRSRVEHVFADQKSRMGLFWTAPILTDTLFDSLTGDAIRIQRTSPLNDVSI